jgi:hypothetical protein
MIKKKPFNFMLVAIGLSLVPLVAHASLSSERLDILNNIKNPSLQSSEDLSNNLLKIEQWTAVYCRNADPAYCYAHIAHTVKQAALQAAELSKKEPSILNRQMLSRVQKILTGANAGNLRAQLKASIIFMQDHLNHLAGARPQKSRFSDSSSSKPARNRHFKFNDTSDDDSSDSATLAIPSPVRPSKPAAEVVAPEPAAAAPASPTAASAVAPAAAPAVVAPAAPAKPAKVIPHKGELKAADLSEVFFDFAVGFDGPNPDNSAKISGLVFSDCAGMFHFAQEKSPSGATCANSVGFKIVDTGGGRQCVADHKAAGKDCNHEEGACQRLSTREDTAMDLRTAGNVSIKLFYEDFGKDSDRMQCVDFGDRDLFHKNASTIAQEKKQEAESKLQNKIELLEHQYRSCRNSEDDLETAREAILKLSSLTSKGGELFEKREKELNNAHFALLAKKIMSVPQDDLSALRERFISWSSEHTGDNQKCVDALRQIALRYAQQNPTPESFDRAAETITEAKEIAEKDAVKNALDKDLFMTKIGRVTLMAQYGLQQNPEFQTAYDSLLKELRHKVSASCIGRGVSPEGCAGAIRVLDQFVLLPEKAREVDNNQTQMHQHIQQRMQQAGMPSQGNSGQAGGANGLHAYGNNMGMSANPGMNGMHANGPMGAMNGMNNMPGMFGMNGMHGMNGMNMNPYSPMGGIGFGNSMYGNSYGNSMGMVNPIGMYGNSMYGNHMGMGNAYPMMNGMFGGMGVNPMMSPMGMNPMGMSPYGRTF